MDPFSRTLERYLARQIYAAVGFVLLGFLALFAFFDLIKELADLGSGEYHLPQIFAFVLLSVPAHAYELFPVVVLIGTLYVLAHLAGNSEYTVMRGSGFSPARAGLVLTRIGLAFVLATFVIGEWIAPFAEEEAQKLRLRAMSSLIGDALQSGLWFKDEGSFINVREARRANVLQGVRIYEFDSAYRLRQMTAAQRAGGSAHRAHAEVRVALGGDSRPAGRPARETGANVGVGAPQVHPAPRRQPAENRGVRDRAVEEAALPARHAGDDGARAALRLHAGARGHGRRQGVFRHHARHFFSHAEQLVFPHRPAAELAALRRRGGAECRVPRLGDAHDVVGRAALASSCFLCCPAAMA